MLALFWRKHLLQGEPNGLTIGGLLIFFSFLFFRQSIFTKKFKWQSQIGLANQKNDILLLFAIWVMQNVQAEPPYLLCHTSMFFALLRFQNGLDTVHNSPNKTNKINEVANDMQILTITAVSLLKLPEKFVRFDNPIHRFHFTRLFLGEKIFETWSLLKPSRCAS